MVLTRLRGELLEVPDLNDVSHFLLDPFFVEIAILAKGHNFLKSLFFVNDFVDIHG